MAAEEQHPARAATSDGPLPLEFLFSREIADDPYSQWVALRERGPVHQIDYPPGAVAFLVVDYEHGRAALSDPRLSKDHTNSMVRVPGELVFENTLLGMDPPDHTRLRKLVSKAFTARRSEAMRPRIQQLADELLDAVAGADEVDLISAYAFPLPIMVICELLGAPTRDRDRFRDWSVALTVPVLTREALERRREAAGEFTAYLLEVFAERQEQPGDDLISALLRVRDGSAALSDQELLEMIMLLLRAGHETTVHLIGNGMAALLESPDQLKLLRESPELIPGAVEEMLRHDGPVHRASQRIALEDMEIAGTPIPKGAWVHVVLGALNRDPAVFADPDTLDVTRPASRHVAFGHGVHYCLGAPLARLEGQIAIATLLDRFPDIELAVPPEKLRRWRNGSILRGLTELPVRLRAS